MATPFPAMHDPFWQLVDGSPPYELSSVLNFLTPATCHTMLAEPSSAIVLVDRFILYVENLIHSVGREEDPDNRAHDTLYNCTQNRCIALQEVTRMCHCGDDAILDRLIASLPAVYTPDCLRKVPSLEMYVTLLEVLIHRVADKPASGRRGGGRGVARRTPQCAPADDDATRRARLTRLASAAPLVLTMAAEWLSVVVDRPYSVQDRVQSLVVFATVCPRELLSTVPEVMAQVVRHMSSLLTPLPAVTGAASSLLLQLLGALKELVTVDAPHFRAIPAVPRLLVKLDRWMGRDAELADTILSLLCVYGVVWQGLARPPATDVADLLVRYATAPPAGAPPDFVPRAANLALHVAVGADSSVSHTVPAALLDAKPQWRLAWLPVAGTRLGSTFQALYRLGDSTSRAARGAAQPTPWAPAPCPPSCVQFLGTSAGRCWGCGNDHAADAPDSPVKRCSKCSVALYCSAACSSASWAHHKRACPGWARLGDQAVKAEESRQAASSSTSRAPAAAPRLRARRALYTATQEDFSGNWKTDWKWPAAKARQVEAAGLQLRDVVCLVERASGAVVLAPAEAYAHWPGAVPRSTLEAPLAKNNGRMLRVIHRVHPPHVMSFGPKSLGLAPLAADAEPPAIAPSMGGASARPDAAAPAPRSAPGRDGRAGAVDADDGASDSDDSMVAAFNAAASISSCTSQPLDPSVAAEVRAWRAAGTVTAVPRAPVPVVSMQSVRVVRPPEDPTDPPTLKVRLLVRAYEHMNRTMGGGRSSGGADGGRRNSSGGSCGGRGSSDDGWDGGGNSGAGLAGFPAGSAGALRRLLPDCNPLLVCEDVIQALGGGVTHLHF